MNKATILGNLGADVVLNHTPSGNPVANLRIATNEVWKDKDGNTQKRTEWHRVVAWGKTAENCAKFLKKGSSCVVEGKIQTREWTDKEGQKRYTTEIQALSIKFLSTPKGSQVATSDVVAEEMPVESDELSQQVEAIFG